MYILLQLCHPAMKIPIKTLTIHDHFYICSKTSLRRPCLIEVKFWDLTCLTVVLLFDFGVSAGFKQHDGRGSTSLENVIEIDVHS